MDRQSQDKICRIRARAIRPEPRSRREDGNCTAQAGFKKKGGGELDADTRRVGRLFQSST
ncbi:hypothetical protein EYF80_046478 [Liparis tanakae]|uniref:Uncharacterized protein n=1 Tax=Liparis tanakae TaxID=230148 RepID=A0A4Z2FSF1_9TELE|nr:hypothetical protein EYF80_046478 [Liparis tanakae]